MIAVAACAAVVACAPPSREAQVRGQESPYLLVFAGDADEASSDFLAVIDLRPDSPNLG